MHGKLLALSILLATLSASPGVLGKEAGPRWYHLATPEGIALGGYDVVAYFTENTARRGTKRWKVEMGGIEYRFSSEDHRTRFEADPERYTPQFGGWCALYCALDRRQPTAFPRRRASDPTNFKIVDDKLLLFSRSPGQDSLVLWGQEDESAQLANATKFWASRVAIAESVGEKPEGFHPRAFLETLQYNFFIGEWESEYKTRVDPAKQRYGPLIRGDWKAWYGWDGFAIFDDWKQSGVVGGSGPAIRSWDPAGQEWVMFFIPINAPMSSVWKMTGGFDEKGELEAMMSAIDRRGQEFLQKVRFIDISKNHFSWRSDRSYDGGETWLENWGVGENYRKGTRRES